MTFKGLGRPRTGGSIRQAAVMVMFAAAVFLMTAPRLYAATPAAGADIKPGTIVNKSNWQLVEKNLPSSMVAWVKKGDFILKIGKLNYDPNWTTEFRKASEENAGKYGIDPQGGLILKSSGKRPPHTYGYPFPTINTSDSHAGDEIMWNKWFADFQSGSTYAPFQVEWVGRDGMERELFAQVSALYYDGNPKIIPNPDKTELREVIQIFGPADIAGNIQLTWRYMSDQPDSVWAYAPAIRRVRQLTAADRSDPFFGSDFVNDDSNIWYGKNQSFKWKLLGSQDVYVPTVGPNPIILQPGIKWSGGQEWRTPKDYPGVVWGYQDKSWKGAPWAPINVIWVKRPCWVIQGFPKDPYYSYGKQIFYIDKENYISYYKVVYARSGEYWKTVMIDLAMAWTPDKGKTGRYGTVDFTLAKDDKTDHASTNYAAGGIHHNIFLINTPRLKPSLFTEDGLLKWGK